MRVLIISTEGVDNIYGGLGIHVRYLCNHLKCDVTLLTPDIHTTPKKYHLLIPNLQPNPLLKTPFEELLAKQKQMVIDAVKRHLEKPFDLIHAHDWGAYSIGKDIREITNIPLITTFHLFQREILEVEGLDRTPENMHSIKMEMDGIINSDKLIFCSHYMRDYTEKGFNIQVLNSEIVPNAVSIEEFQINPQTRKPLPVILFCGRFSKQKGFEDILRCIESTDKYVFKLMGRLPTPNKDQIEKHIYTKIINKLMRKYPDRIELVGHKDGLDKIIEFKTSDLVLMPSLTEPYGIVALEAFASKIPLVCTHTGGMREFVNENNAWICKPNYNSILKHIDRCLSDPNKTEKVEKGYDFVSSYSWNNVADKIEKIYEGVIKNGSRSTIKPIGINTY